MSIKSPTALINRFATKELIVTQISLLIRMLECYIIFCRVFILLLEILFSESSPSPSLHFGFLVLFLKCGWYKVEGNHQWTFFWWDSVFKVVLLWVGVGLGILWSLIEKWVFDSGKGHLVLLGIYNYSEMM